MCASEAKGPDDPARISDSLARGYARQLLREIRASEAEAFSKAFSMRPKLSSERSCRRAMGRFRQAMKSFLVADDIWFEKRKVLIGHLTWTVLGPDELAELDQERLALKYQLLQGNYRGEPDIHDLYIASLSRHALERMIQRHGSTDIYEVLRELRLAARFATALAGVYALSARQEADYVDQDFFEMPLAVPTRSGLLHGQWSMQIDKAPHATLTTYVDVSDISEKNRRLRDALMTFAPPDDEAIWLDFDLVLGIDEPVTVEQQYRLNGLYQTMRRHIKEKEAANYDRRE